MEIAFQIVVDGTIDLPDVEFPEDLTPESLKAFWDKQWEEFSDDLDWVLENANSKDCELQRIGGT